MSAYDNTVVMLEILPSMLRTLRQGFRPDMDIKLNASERKTLMYLFRNEGLPMTHYSLLNDMEKGSFTYATDNLEKKGLIMRESCPCDRRKKMLVLTTYGRKVAGNIKCQFDRHLAERLSVLSDKDRSELEAAISIIADIQIKLIERGK